MLVSGCWGGLWSRPALVARGSPPVSPGAAGLDAWQAGPELHVSGTLGPARPSVAKFLLKEEKNTQTCFPEEFSS